MSVMRLHRDKCRRQSANACSCRCLVAYSGHHYQAYALVEELGRWLLFDDAAIRMVGGWADVAASMRACRHQPSLLFYERVD